MPLYEFECASCGDRFDEYVAVGGEPPHCRACGASETKRIYSAPAPPAGLTNPGRLRKLEQARGTDRGGAKERFSEQRRRERAKKGSR